MARQFIPRASKMAALATLGLAMLVVALSDPSSGGRVAQAKDRKSDPMRERLARGRYLVEGPMHCFACQALQALRLCTRIRRPQLNRTLGRAGCGPPLRRFVRPG